VVATGSDISAANGNLWGLLNPQNVKFDQNLPEFEMSSGVIASAYIRSSYTVNNEPYSSGLRYSLNLGYINSNGMRIPVKDIGDVIFSQNAYIPKDDVYNTAVGTTPVHVHVKCIGLCGSTADETKPDGVFQTYYTVAIIATIVATKPITLEEFKKYASPVLTFKKDGVVLQESGTMWTGFTEVSSDET
jgi:hypothetical protein